VSLSKPSAVPDRPMQPACAGAPRTKHKPAAINASIEARTDEIIAPPALLTRSPIQNTLNSVPESVGAYWRDVPNWSQEFHDHLRVDCCNGYIRPSFGSAVKRFAKLSLVSLITRRGDHPGDRASSTHCQNVMRLACSRRTA